jgi:hypothetical protein
MKIGGAAKDTEILCIGLDIAWHGGSLGQQATQNDCLVYSIFNPMKGQATLHLKRVRLENRDEFGEQIADAIARVMSDHSDVARVALAIDAPLQAVGAIPAGQTRARRACEVVLNERRKAIDHAAGGAAGWHPAIQPGAPIPPRVERVVALLKESLGFEVWHQDTATSPQLILECFPAEAIWSAKRMGAYLDQRSGQQVKAYKRQRGQYLTMEEVDHFVKAVLLNGFDSPWRGALEWTALVEQLVQQMLALPDWVVDGRYRGGKLLDDMIDSALCMATALSYANGTVHIWVDPQHLDDGHIMGPGPMDLLTMGRGLD